MSTPSTPSTVYVLQVTPCDYGDPEDPRVFLTREGVEEYMRARGFTPKHRRTLAWEALEDGLEVDAWARETRLRQ